MVVVVDRSSGLLCGNSQRKKRLKATEIASGSATGHHKTPQLHCTTSLHITKLHSPILFTMQCCPQNNTLLEQMNRQSKIFTS